MSGDPKSLIIETMEQISYSMRGSRKEKKFFQFLMTLDLQVYEAPQKDRSLTLIQIFLLFWLRLYRQML